MFPFKQKDLCDAGSQATVGVTHHMLGAINVWAYVLQLTGVLRWQEGCWGVRNAEAGGSKPAWDAGTNPTALSWIPCHSQPRPAAIFVEQWEPWGQCHLLSGSCSWRSSPLALPGLLLFPDKWTFSYGAHRSLVTPGQMTIEITPLIYLSLQKENKFQLHLCSRHAQLSVWFWVVGIFGVNF